MKPLKIRQTVFDASAGPVICAPLIGVTEAELEGELAEVLTTKPHMLEWRIDFFAGIEDTARCARMARQIRTMAGDIPILLTRRSMREGGQPLILTDLEVLDRYRAITQTGAVDVLDWELGSDLASFDDAVRLAKETNTKLIASYHNFERTPVHDELVAKFSEAASRGADIAKIAVMPQSRKDVLTLLNATLEADVSLDISIVSMAMGAMGSCTRLMGWLFGSAMTFGVGSKLSAPGQIPVADVVAAVRIIKRYSEKSA